MLKDMQFGLQERFDVLPFRQLGVLVGMATAGMPKNLSFCPYSISPIQSR